MSFKILATADLHLGRYSSQLPETQVEDIGPTTQVLSDIRQQALANEVDAVVIAGDIIDDHNDFLEIYDALNSFFQALLDHQIHVIAIAGNHDFDTFPEFVKHWKNPGGSHQIHLLSGQSAWNSVKLENASGETVEFLGWSFEKKYCHTDPTDHLKPKQIETDIPTVALLHGDAYDKESAYAPVDFNQAQKFEVQAWVLGHIHKPDILSQDQPFIAYPGSPQPLSPKETGEHGLLLLEIEPSKRVTFREIPLTNLRYHDHTTTLSENIDPDALRTHILNELNNLQNAQLNIVNLELAGTYPDLELIDDIADEFNSQGSSQSSVFIQKVVNRVEPAIEDLREIAAEKNPPGIIAQALIDLEENQPNAFLDELKQKIKDCQQRIDQSTTYNLLANVSLEEHENDLEKERSGEIDLLLEQTLWEMLYTLRKQKEEVHLG